MSRMKGNWEMQGLANPTVVKSRKKPFITDIYIDIDGQHLPVKDKQTVVWGKWGHTYWEKDGHRVAVHRSPDYYRGEVWLMSQDEDGSVLSHHKTWKPSKVRPSESGRTGGVLSEEHARELGF